MMVDRDIGDVKHIASTPNILGTAQEEKENSTVCHIATNQIRDYRLIKTNMALPFTTLKQLGNALILNGQCMQLRWLCVL